MLERHVGKGALRRRQGLVRTRIVQGLGRLQRQRVAGEGLRRAAVDVAGELVQHDDARQRALGAFVVPLAQAARQGLLDHVAELLEDGAVEGIVLAPPFGALHIVALGADRQEPEIENVL